jgi:protein CpxP
MKKITVLLLAFVIATSAAFAQQKRDAKNQYKKHKHDLMQQLNLSDQQKQQAKQYKEEYKKQMIELNKNENITVKEQRDRKEALRKQQKAKMENLLTAEQKTKRNQLKAEQKAKAEEQYAKRLDKMKSKLNLTDGQVNTMKEQRTAMQARLKSIKENEALSRIEKKEQLMALKATAKEQHKKIFTADQLQKIETMKKEK